MHLLSTWNESDGEDNLIDSNKTNLRFLPQLINVRILFPMSENYGYSRIRCNSDYRSIRTIIQFWHQRYIVSIYVAPPFNETLHRGPMVERERPIFASSMLSSCVVLIIARTIDAYGLRIDQSRLKTVSDMCDRTTWSASRLTAVDGQWSAWGEWDDCSVTCDQGYKTRYRSCSNPTPAHGGKNCAGSYSEERKCNLGDCGMFLT